MSQFVDVLGAWARRRQLIVTAFIFAGTLVFVALWLMETRTGLIADSDRWAYPLIITFLVGNLVLIRLAPRLQAGAEMACFVGVAGYLLAQMVCFAFSPSETSIYNIAAALVWMPSLYVAAFMFFDQRRAILAAASVFALSAVALGAAIVITIGHGKPALPALLGNALASHLLVLLLLSLVMVLRSEFERVSLHARTMEDAANTDPLTGIANRRALEEWMQARDREASPTPVALVLFDIDHFKTINDRHGHLVGDEILIAIAQLIRGQLRIRDIVGRWGGEEFLVVIEDANAMHAVILAERVRQMVTVLVHPVAGAATISAGVAVALPGQPTEIAFRAADAALYSAKSAGRNRVASV